MGNKHKAKGTAFETLIKDYLISKNFTEARRAVLAGENDTGYDKITSDLLLEDKGVETVIVDATWTGDTGNTEYLGKVVLNPDNSFAFEDGDVVLDAYADEINSTKETA